MTSPARARARHSSSGTVTVAVLAVHPATVAATRLRATQYMPAFADQGVSMRVWSLLRDRDLPAWYGRSQVQRAWTLLMALLRLPAVLRVLAGSDVVLVQREALPLGPPLLELLAARRRLLIWDVDDAIWQPFTSPTAGRVPQWVRATGRKYERLCRRADEVWAGSDVLAEWCREHSSRVQVVPSVVPVPDSLPESRPDRVVGWIGSHSTGQFVEDVLPAVCRAKPSPHVVVVGAAPRVPDGGRVDVLSWSPATEADILRRSRVGLYPVDRGHPLAEGKCGLKAILYMAHGIPCVVTPTRTNAKIVRDGIDGLHADTEEQWTTATQKLLDDDELWLTMRRAAHQRAFQHFSLQTWGPQLARRVRALAGGR